MSRWTEIKEWLRDNPKTAFVLGAIALTMIAWFVFSPQPRVARPPIDNTTAEKTAETAKEPVNKLGLKYMVNGDLVAEEISPTDTAISGNAYETVIRIKGDNEWYLRKFYSTKESLKQYINTTPYKTGLVLIPVSGYSHARFTLEQPFTKNTDNKGITEVTVSLDGKVIKNFTISPEQMLTQPILIDVNTTGKGMLSIKLRVDYTTANDYFIIGYPYPLWICEPILTKEGGHGY